MKRAAFVVFWAFVGAVSGFLLGTIVGELLQRASPDMDEAEFVMAGLLVPFAATVVGALVGGVVGARLERQ